MGQMIEDSSSRVPTKNDRLIGEYKEIVIEDIPDGLPPMRSISHCMNLIYRASFPNKAPYRLTPTKNVPSSRVIIERFDQREFDFLCCTCIST